MKIAKRNDESARCQPDKFQRRSSEVDPPDGIIAQFNADTDRSTKLCHLRRRETAPRPGTEEARIEKPINQMARQ
jgi:hypothetical protein